MSNPIAPPQAPNLETLFDFAGAVSPLFKDALTDAGINQVLSERDAATQATPRVECQLQIGAVISKTKLPAGFTNIRDRLPSVYACALIFSVVTDRTNNPEQHGPYEARVRIMAARFFHGLNTRLPYHLFEELDEAGTTLMLVNDKAEQEDISQIRFAGKLRIRDTAWPVGV